MKNKLINFSKNIFKEFLKLIKELILILILLIVSLIAFSIIICIIGIPTTLFVKDTLNISNIFNNGADMIGFIGVLGIVCTVLVDIIKSIIQGIIKCWKNS